MMSEIKSTISKDNDVVITEIEIAAPPARVFQALVEREQALQWGSGEDFEIIHWEMDVRPGGKWSFSSRERDPAGKVFDHNGEVLKLDPPHLLEISWFASWHPDLTHPTIVRWELTPTKIGTRLKVTHSNLAPLAGAAQGYGQGWPALVQQIKKFVEK